MNTGYNEYRNVTFLMAGLACFLVLATHIVLANTPDKTHVHIWAASVGSLATPILFFWIGGLLRSITSEPRKWIRTVLLASIPLMYVLLVLFPGYDFYRLWPGYDMLMLSLAILGYLSLTVAESVESHGWLAFLLFVASSFCYVGVVRVSDHFGMANFVLRNSELTILFTRLMKVVPLVMSLFFLMVFALSDVGQRIGSSKWIKWIAIILCLVSGIYLYSFIPYVLRRSRLFNVHPLTVYLVAVIIRGTKRHKTMATLKDIFIF